MSKGFNLVDAAWIPCATENGSVELHGLLNTLGKAYQFKEIRDGSPLVTVALHRLLLAVLHRVFGPATPEVWEHLWKSRCFDRAQLEKYLRGPLIYERFDLFDEKHPFYQTALLDLGDVNPKTGRQKCVKPIWHMAHELAYSDNLNLFSHCTEYTLCR